MVMRVVAALMRRSPAVKRALWNGWYSLLARRLHDSAWTFMNHGFAGASASRLELLPEDEPDRFCIQLYHHVASGDQLRDKSVLEVGCGRGGGASYISRYLHPKRVVGMDRASAAIQFCRARHRGDNLAFVPGDAENLPFRDNSFDVVLNVESSHSYPDFARFLTEVKRVLRPGGSLLWADCGEAEALRALREQFARCGLRVRSEHEITSGVVAALSKDSERKRAEIEKRAPRLLRGVFANFAGLEGTDVYSRFASGRYSYVSCVLENP